MSKVVFDNTVEDFKAGFCSSTRHVQSATVGADQSKHEDLFVKIESYSSSKEHEAFENLKGKRVRVTITVEDE